MNLTLTAAAASLALVATNVAAAQSTTDTMTKLENASRQAVFASWDKDDNNKLTKQEFMSGLKGQNWFQHVDTDRNGRISKSEFKTHLKAMNVYEKADLNNSGSVEQQEANRLLGENRAAAWNTRQPASLSADELYEGLYDAWSSEASSGLTREEMLTGVFESADCDGDGIISKTEFARDVALAKGNTPDAMSTQSRHDRSGSDRAVGTTGAVAASTVEDIVDNPDAYIGEQVTVSGTVGEVFGQRVFNIEEQGMIDVDDELLVLAPKNSAAVTADSMVQVHGKLRRIATSDLEAEFGPAYWTDWGVYRDFFTARETHPVLYADTIDVRR
jgi:Ca2+-binding EF-hand superfamily protein